MPKQFQRQDFVVKDLVISVGSGGGSTWLPAEDGVVPPSPISPIASVVLNAGIVESIRATVQDALKSGKDLESIGRAFVQGDAGGNAAIRSAIYEIGSAVVASTAYAALGGGSAGLPNPECGGSSLETIPPTLTPVVNVGREVHRIAELPRLRKQLAVAVDFVDKAAVAHAPRGAEVGIAREQLEGALNSLRG